MMNSPPSTTDPLSHGIDLFNRREFYQCHDAVEAIWLEESSDEQPFLQGIIQAAVAFFHFEEGRRGAARAMLRLALEKFQPYPPQYRGVHLEPFVGDLRRWKEALDRSIRTGAPLPELSYPTIECLGEDRSGQGARE